MATRGMKNQTDIKDYYECPRCSINSLDSENCPCPRGSCEAIIAGTLLIQSTTILDDELTLEQKEWNYKFRGHA